MREFRPFCEDFEKKAAEAEMEKEALSPEFLRHAADVAKKKAKDHLSKANEMAKYIDNSKSLKGRLVNKIRDKIPGKKEFGTWSVGELKRYHKRNWMAKKQKFSQSKRLLEAAEDRARYGHPSTRGLLDKVRRKLNL